MIPRARSGQSNHFHALAENPVEASMQTLPLMKKTRHQQCIFTFRQRIYLEN